MPLSKTPWIPSLNGKVLGPCALILDLVKYKAGPDFRKSSDRSWTEAGVESALVGVPAARDAILETVLAIWRLKEKEEVGCENPDWKNHLEAWLTRHRDLCRDAGIPGLRVIVDFADAARVMGFLPESRIPSFRTTIPRTKKLSRLSDVLMAEAEESDVDDEDSEDIADEPTLRNKGKARVEVMVGKGAKVSGVSKRSLQDSPTRVGPVAKRVRVEEGLKSKGLDLSGYTVEEFDRVEEEQIPGASTKVCDYCQQRGANCKAVWGFNGAARTIRCHLCRHAKKKCSFNTRNWGIAIWPEIEKSEEGNMLRAAAAAAKYKGRAARAQNTPEEIPSASKRSRTRVRANKPSQSISISSTPEPAIVALPSTSVHPTVVGPSTAAPQLATTPMLIGTRDSIIFEDLRRFEELLCSPNISISELGMAIADLKGIEAREDGDLESMRIKIMTRWTWISDLIERLQDRVVVLRAPVWTNADNGPSKTKVVMQDQNEN